MKLAQMLLCTAAALAPILCLRQELLLQALKLVNAVQKETSESLQGLSHVEMKCLLVTSLPSLAH